MRFATRSAGGLLPLAAVLFLSACIVALPAHAADDSNAGSLTPAPTVSAQQLGSVLSTLSQGDNDTQLQQLLAQFQSELNSGNETGAATTLVQLQDLTSGKQGVNEQALNALLQSLSIGSGGPSVNANTLSSLLSAASSSGDQSGASAQKLSVDMQSLAGLMQFANSTLASELLQNSDALSQSAFQGGVPAGAPISLPGVGGLSGLSVPSIGAPSVGVGAPSGGLPSVPLVAFLFPLVAAAAAAAIYYSRGRIVRLIGSQSLPRISLLGRASEGVAGEVAETPADPRKRIEFYFGRATRLMARRGVPKLESETHREFSAKCEATPERPHVTAISSLYEKAKFSGQPVGNPEADLAASELSAMGKEER